MPTFLSPLFLIGAAAAAIPIVLHFLKREPEARVKFAAVKLLRQGPVEHDRHRRLRELLLLALRVTAVVLLALAFARPFFATAQSGPQSATIVALDTSLSMSASGQLTRAKQMAREVVGNVPSGQRVGVVTFSDTARVASPVSGDRGLAMAAIDAAIADAGATRYRAGLQAGTDLLEDGRGAITVVSDLQESGWDVGDRVTLPETVRVDVADVGAPPQNLSVTAVRVSGERMIATIRNTGAAREARVSVQAGPAGRAGLAATATPSTIAIGADQSADVDLPKPDGETAVVSVADPSGIQADNSRFVVFRGGGRGAVLVVSETGDLAHDAFYIQQALSTAGRSGVAGPSIEGVAAPDLASWTADRLTAFSALVVASTRGLERRGREAIAGYVRGGGGVLVPASVRVDGEILADTFGNPRGFAVATGRGAASDARRLAPVDLRHPLFQAFGDQGAALGLATFTRVSVLRGPECQPLARFTTGDVAILDCPFGDGRAVILAFDLDNDGNDLPRRATFVPFLHEAVRYLSGSGAARSEYIVGEQPARVPRVPGFTHLPAAEGRPARWVAVNVDPRETDPARLTSQEFQGAIAHLNGTVSRSQNGPGPEARKEEDRQHLWQYALAFVIAALVAESLVATRT